MATQKVINNEHVWDQIGRHLFPAGIPPNPDEAPQYKTTAFIGGYPDTYIDPMTLEWDHDFTQAEHDAWDRLVKFARRKVEYDDAADAATEPFITTLKQWKNRTPPATDTQRDAVLDAMVELWRLELKDN